MFGVYPVVEQLSEVIHTLGPQLLCFVCHYRVSCVFDQCVSGGCLAVLNKTWKVSFNILSFECFLKMVCSGKRDQG